MFKVTNLKDKLPPSESSSLKRPKVFVGSASEGLLMAGDKVVGINHQDTSKLTHLEAQNLIKYAGTSAKIDVIRPGFSGQDLYEPQTRDFEVAKVHSQPYRTSPLVTPAPKTINEFGTSNRSKSLNRQDVSSQPMSPTNNQQQMKTVNIGGTQKQIVSQQFNSPMNMYSEEAIAESALANPALMQSNVPTLGQIQNNYHPGYVPSSKPHLPTLSGTYSRPQASETFKIILESEMDKAKDHQSMTGAEFQKDKHPSRPSSVMSNNSSKTHDPFMGNNTISQSTSFKRLMYSVLGEAEM